MLLSWIVLAKTQQLNILDKLMTWPMIGLMVGLMLAFLRRWTTPRRILYATWGSWATYIVFAIGYETYLGDYEPGLSPTVLWFTLVSLITLILFPKRHALGIAGIYNASGVLALGLGLLFNLEVNPKTFNWVAQFVLANMVFVVLLKVHLQLRERFDEANVMAHSDTLTGLANRRQMQKLLESEVARGERYQQHFSVLLLDLDYFKTINDQWGHAIGDQVLKEVSRLFSNLLRDTDSIARWGGEEFLVLAPNTTALQAEQLAQRLRQTLNQSKIAGHLTLTMSIGIAQHNPSEPLQTLLQNADTALYRAKDNGRNRVETHSL